MKIDYDELRQQWTQAIEANKVANFYTFASMAPEKALRLLEIIGIAKKGLSGEVCSDEACRHDECAWARGVLDDIAKLEQAHECPQCGMLCGCDGDPENVYDCTHCTEDEYPDEFNEDDE